MKPIFYGWWIVLACFINAFYVAGIIFYGFTALIEPLVDEFGWSYAQISFAASLRGLEMGIMAPFVGFFVDRFGSRRLLTSGIIILGFAIILLGYTQSLFMFYCSFVLMAFGAGGCTSVVTLTAIANWFDKNVGKAMGVMVSGFGASGLLIPVIVWLIGIYGWRTAVIILGIGTWIFLLPLSAIIRDKPEDYGYVPDGVESDPKASKASDENGNAPLEFRDALRERTFWYVNITEVIRLMGLATVITHIMPYLSTLEYSRTLAGFVAAGIPFFSIGGRFGFGWLGDVVEKKYVMAIAYGLMGLGMLSLGFAETRGLIYVFLFFFSSGFGGLAVLRSAILREHYGRTFFGKLMGIMMGFGAVGGIIGPTVAGWVFDRMGTYHYVWLTLGVLVGVAVFLILGVEAKKKK